MSSLGDGNLTELYVGYVLINYKLKTDLQCCMVGEGLRGSLVNNIIVCCLTCYNSMVIKLATIIFFFLCVIKHKAT